MKQIKQYIFIIVGILIMFSFTNELNSIPVPNGIIVALRTGNAVSLSKYFNANVELAINNTEDIYSKGQAELILKDFFAKHVPNSFEVLHEGGKEESKYAIGNLSTTNGKFRVTLLIKQKDNQSLIHQLRIEEENE